MTRSVPDNLYLEDGKTGVREFRVSRMDRYKVTEWESFNGSRTRVVAENLTLAQANAIAMAFGAQHPGSLVNGMDAPDSNFTGMDWGEPYSRDNLPPGMTLETWDFYSGDQWTAEEVAAMQARGAIPRLIGVDLADEKGDCSVKHPLPVKPEAS